MGHFFSIIREPQGQPMRRWINEVEHKGIVRYLDFFNKERIAVFGSEALTDILISKPYDFVKPIQIARGIGNVLGAGLFLSECDEHKVHVHHSSGFND